MSHDPYAQARLAQIQAAAAVKEAKDKLKRSITDTTAALHAANNAQKLVQQMVDDCAMLSATLEKMQTLLKQAEVSEDPNAGLAILWSSLDDTERGTLSSANQWTLPTDDNQRQRWAATATNVQEKLGTAPAFTSLKKQLLLDFYRYSAHKNELEKTPGRAEKLKQHLSSLKNAKPTPASKIEAAVNSLCDSKPLPPSIGNKTLSNLQHPEGLPGSTTASKANDIIRRLNSDLAAYDKTHALINNQLNTPAQNKYHQALERRIKDDLAQLNTLLNARIAFLKMERLFIPEGFTKTLKALETHFDTEPRSTLKPTAQAAAISISQNKVVCHIFEPDHKGGTKQITKYYSSQVILMLLDYLQRECPDALQSVHIRKDGSILFFMKSPDLLQKLAIPKLDELQKQIDEQKSNRPDATQLTGDTEADTSRPSFTTPHHTWRGTAPSVETQPTPSAPDAGFNTPSPRC